MPPEDNAEVTELRLDMERRTVLGIATGIVMARLDVDGEEALRYLERLAAMRKLVLYEVACEVAADRLSGPARDGEA
jgi:AmiR/NasT family two-component response regulator